MQNGFSLIQSHLTSSSKDSARKHKPVKQPAKNLPPVPLFPQVMFRSSSTFSVPLSHPQELARKPSSMPEHKLEHKTSEHTTWVFEHIDINHRIPEHYKVQLKQFNIDCFGYNFWGVRHNTQNFVTSLIKLKDHYQELQKIGCFNLGEGLGVIVVSLNDDADYIGHLDAAFTLASGEFTLNNVPFASPPLELSEAEACRYYGKSISYEPKKHKQKKFKTPLPKAHSSSASSSPLEDDESKGTFLKIRVNPSRSTRRRSSKEPLQEPHPRTILPNLKKISLINKTDLDKWHDVYKKDLTKVGIEKSDNWLPLVVLSAKKKTCLKVLEIKLDDGTLLGDTIGLLELESRGNKKILVIFAKDALSKPEGLRFKAHVEAANCFFRYYTQVESTSSLADSRNPSPEPTNPDLSPLSAQDFNLAISQPSQADFDLPSSHPHSSISNALGESVPLPQFHWNAKSLEVLPRANPSQYPSLQDSAKRKVEATSDEPDPKRLKPSALPTPPQLPKDMEYQPLAVSFQPF